jgi:hypothetical protein
MLTFRFDRTIADLRGSDPSEEPIVESWYPTAG